MKRTLLLAVLVAGGSRSAPAQAVRVRAVEEGGRGAVVGALVSLREDPAVVLVQSLTDEGGRALLRAPRPGRFFVHLDRIGFQGTTVGPIAVGVSDTVAADVIAPNTRVLLPDLTVTSGAPAVCRLDSKVGALVSMLWTEARKVLIGAELTKLPMLEVTRYQRGYAPGSSIAEESSTRFRTDSVTPFVAADAERLRHSGYLEQAGASTLFLAPDAKVLLSEDFLADHCFQVVEPPPGSNLVGLGFEPVPDRTKPDVAGTLWLDRLTTELRYFEFEYRNLHKTFRTGHEGGRVDYVRLPNGGWIVAKWRVRVAWHERGGEVALVGPDGKTPGGAVLVGTVFDSLQKAPLAGAIVSAGGGAYVDTTEADGTYRLEMPTEGDFSVSVAHPLLALLDWPTTARAAAVIRGQEVRADFAVPGPETVVRRACFDRAIAPDAEAVVVGQLTDSAGLPRPGEVVVAWSEPTVLRAGHRLSIGEYGYRVVVPSDLQGRFRVCGVPAGVDLEIGVVGRKTDRRYHASARPGDLIVAPVRVLVP